MSLVSSEIKCVFNVTRAEQNKPLIFWHKRSTNSLLFVSMVMTHPILHPVCLSSCKPSKGQKAYTVSLETEYSQLVSYTLIFTQTWCHMKATLLPCFASVSSWLVSIALHKHTLYKTHLKRKSGKCWVFFTCFHDTNQYKSLSEQRYRSWCTSFYKPDQTESVYYYTSYIFMR